MSILELRDLISKNGDLMFYDLSTFYSFYENDIKPLGLRLGSDLGNFLGLEFWT